MLAGVFRRSKPGFATLTSLVLSMSKAIDLSTRVQLSFLEQNTMSTAQISLSPEAKKLFKNTAESMLDRAVDDFNVFFHRDFGMGAAISSTWLSSHFRDADEWIDRLPDFEIFEDIATRVYGETGCLGLCYQLNAPSALMTELESMPSGFRHLECKLQGLIDEYIKVDVRQGDADWEPDDYGRTATWAVESWYINFFIDREGLKKHLNSVLDAAA